jgi:hypothetical protein
VPALVPALVPGAAHEPPVLGKLVPPHELDVVLVVLVVFVFVPD